MKCGLLGIRLNLDIRQKFALTTMIKNTAFLTNKQRIVVSHLLHQIFEFFLRRDEISVHLCLISGRNVVRIQTFGFHIPVASCVALRGRYWTVGTVTRQNILKQREQGIFVR